MRDNCLLRVIRGAVVRSIVRIGSAAVLAFVALTQVASGEEIALICDPLRTSDNLVPIVIYIDTAQRTIRVRASVASTYADGHVSRETDGCPRSATQFVNIDNERIRFGINYIYLQSCGTGLADKGEGFMEEVIIDRLTGLYSEAVGSSRLEHTTSRQCRRIVGNAF
jgi:hypothetical protein